MHTIRVGGGPAILALVLLTACSSDSSDTGDGDAGIADGSFADQSAPGDAPTSTGDQSAPESDASDADVDATQPSDSASDVGADVDGAIDAAIDANEAGASGDAGTDAQGADAGDAAPLDASACGSGPADDHDSDGWTVAQGDCNDCDPLVNPGAIDALHTPADGGAPTWSDDDCSGTAAAPAACDQGLALDDVDPIDGAKAIDLCQLTTGLQRNWGVVKAQYVRANGTALTPGPQVGIEGAFGPNVSVKSGANMLLLSSGHARTPSQTGACGSASCSENATGTAPVGFPHAAPGCMQSSTITDDAALELELRVPTNATGYSFAFKFHSFEYPEYVCNSFNDQFIALVSPAPAGSSGGNVSFDSLGRAISVNAGFFDVCDPAGVSLYASQCTGTCPSAPNPYCPAGASQLSGTGFDVWATAGQAGATSWLRTQAPVQGGTTVTIRFAIWDGGDQGLDSSVLVDDFQWITTTPVTISTTPMP